MCEKAIMTIMGMICCLSLNSLAEGAEAPKIISWSNSKTGNEKTVFVVEPGEKITFSVKADGAEKYLWPYNVRDNVLVHASQKGIYMEAGVHDAIIINNTVKYARPYGRLRRTSSKPC